MLKIPVPTPLGGVGKQQGDTATQQPARAIISLGSQEKRSWHWPLTAESCSLVCKVGVVV